MERTKTALEFETWFSKIVQNVPQSKIVEHLSKQSVYIGAESFIVNFSNDSNDFIAEICDNFHLSFNIGPLNVKKINEEDFYSEFLRCLTKRTQEHKKVEYECLDTLKNFSIFFTNTVVYVNQVINRVYPITDQRRCTKYPFLE